MRLAQSALAIFCDSPGYGATVASVNNFYIININIVECCVAVSGAAKCTVNAVTHDIIRTISFSGILRVRHCSGHQSNARVWFSIDPSNAAICYRSRQRLISQCSRLYAGCHFPFFFFSLQLHGNRRSLGWLSHSPARPGQSVLSTLAVMVRDAWSNQTNSFTPVYALSTSGFSCIAQLRRSHWLMCTTE